jgi:hypothetical protein
MKWVNRIGRAFAVLAVMLLMGGIANAQTLSNQASVNLSMSVSESVSISATPANISFTYSPSGGGTATASGQITVVTTANLASGHSYLNVYGFLSSATAALSGPSNIPSSEVFANTTGNGSMGSATGAGAVPCTGNFATVGVQGAECGSIGGPDDFLDSTRGAALTPGGQFTITDNVTLSLANLGTLTPGSYTGVINFQASYL